MITVPDRPVEVDQFVAVRGDHLGDPVEGRHHLVHPAPHQDPQFSAVVRTGASHSAVSSSSNRSTLTLMPRISRLVT